MPTSDEANFKQYSDVFRSHAVSRTELGAHLGQLAQVGGGGILAPVGARFVPYEGYVVELGAAAIASTFRGGYLGRGVQTTFTVKVRGDTGTRFKDVPMSGVVVEEALDENGMVVFKVVYTDGDVSDLSLGDLGRCMDSERFNVMDGGRKEQLIAVVGPHGVSADLGISYGFRASMDGVGRKNTYVHWSGGSADMTENNFFTMSVAKVVGEILHVGICLGAEVDIPQRLETGYRVVWDDKSVQTSVGQEDLVKMCYEFVQRADENISPDKRAFPIRVAIRGELAPGMIAPWVRVEEESESESSGESESEAEWGG